jgi:hypothetical protein
MSFLKHRFKRLTMIYFQQMKRIYCMTKLTVTKVLKDTLVIRQFEGKDCFIATVDSIVISIGSLANILHFLVMNEYLSPKVLDLALFSNE